MGKSNRENARARNVRTLGAVMATACVMGLVGALWLHPDHPLAQFAGTPQGGPTAVPVAAQTAFLHAPAAVSAIPSAEQVFASRRDTSEDDAAAAPSF